MNKTKDRFLLISMLLFLFSSFALIMLSTLEQTTIIQQLMDILVPIIFISIFAAMIAGQIKK